MSLDQLSNCIQCGRVFVKNINSICPRCVEDMNQQYEKCAEYLKDNRGCTIYELSEATDVSVRNITQFIHEGRILVGDLPNLGYPCDTCGELIKIGKICESCSLRITKDVLDVTSRTSEVEEEELNAYLHRRNQNNKKI
ncbi:flagellar protein [Chengkuizengella axinellae]|uniref:Flagellar protein n=1 Tax=Chengkuizengella axinellae TaxID=3064388 RepID=A0ABT9J4K9_9BACL|nr:flagellar protein [Chengkuizengella sp. 2205SS18-9]MDP5275879.1 flagellar protein [Chengkuizengella sp. 2205SS18-9]